MHVWRPAAVDLVTANFGKRRSLRNRFTRVEASERVLAQVTVKGVEGELFAGKGSHGSHGTRGSNGMLQDDGGTIIERCVVVAETMHDAVEWRQDGRTNLHEQIEADMHGTPLGAVVTFNPVLVANVNRTGFVVSADAHAALRALHALEKMLSEPFDVGQILQVA